MSSSNISLAGSLSKGWMARTLDVVFDREYYSDLQKRFEIDRRCNEYARSELADLELYWNRETWSRS